MGDQEARRSELTYEEHCRLLDEITEAGCLWLLYTGGEIFARKDFLDIYTYAKQKGLLIGLFTNGTLITPKIADHLAEWRPFMIEITLYGRTRETYEQLTGIPGSYDRCMRGIRLLMERGLPLALKTVGVTIKSLSPELRVDQRSGSDHVRDRDIRLPLDIHLHPSLQGARGQVGGGLELLRVADHEQRERRAQASSADQQVLTSADDRRAADDPVAVE